MASSAKSRYSAEAISNIFADDSDEENMIGSEW